jgi:HlyD family secretion protein
MKKVLATWILVALLTACGSAQPTPTPAAPAASVAAVVSASGKVLPSPWANISFQTGGLLVELQRQAGDVVKAGEVIARLDDTDAKLAVSQADAALAIAQAQLAQLKAGPRAEQVAQAEQTVAQAEAAWQGAQAQYGQLRSGARAADIAAAEAAVAQATQQQKIMQDAYDLNVKCYSFALPNGTQDSVCPGLGTREEQLRGALHAANEGLTAARARLDQLKQGATKNEIAAATANVNAAKAQLEQAQAQLDLLKAGATPEQIAVIEAGVKQAQVAVDTAKAQLTKTQIVAPFGGTLGTVFVRSGEMVSPGQSIVTLGDLSSLRVETTDLSEADIARVREGAPVNVTFDALPGRTINGKVSRIAPMSTPGVSAVNYTVIVELDQLDPALRWGMTAFVDVQIGQ